MTKFFLKLLTGEGQTVRHLRLPNRHEVLRPRVLARAYDHTRRYCTGKEALVTSARSRACVRSHSKVLHR